jgi:hypothetical protein
MIVKHDETGGVLTFPVLPEFTGKEVKEYAE